MKRLSRIAAVFAGVACAMARLVAAIPLPLELNQADLPFNLQAVGGVPVSDTVGNPAGSDGRAPTPAQQSADGLTTLVPTAGQFRGLVSFGAVPGRTATASQTAAGSTELNSGNAPLSGSIALEMGLPVGTSNNVVVMVLRRALVGAPFMSKQVSLLFGSVIEVPSNDENDKPLPTTVAKEDYWLPEPYTTNSHAGAGYYWSIHSRQVYAIQAGPLSITWKKAVPSTTAPADFATSPSLYSVEGGRYYRLYNSRQIVSGGSVVPTKRMYWTEGSFRQLGKAVPVPDGRVGRVNVVYNNNFPERVAEEFTDIGQSRVTAATNTLQELRTLWYDETQRMILAFNREGRVFVELLGDTRPDGRTRIPLGFEIVDVLKQPAPEDSTVDLGERIYPPSSLGSKSSLQPAPITQLSFKNFGYSHNIVGSDDVELFATAETTNLNDYQVHWLETGVAGLKWPTTLGRYKLVWPLSISRYTHFLRPETATDEQAKLTAVPFSTENVPVIQYQDPMDRPRAKLTEDQRFYSTLDREHPVHRSLISFVAGPEVAFLRVLSILNTEVKVPSVGVGSLANASLDLSAEGSGFGRLPQSNYFDGSSFTIESWVNLRSRLPGQHLVDFGNGPDAANVFVSLADNGTGRPALGIVQGGVLQTVVSTNLLPLGEWVHIAAVFDAGSSKGRIYINGIVDGEGTIQAPENTTRTNNFVGHSNWPNDSATDANIDSLRLWKTARSAGSILATMNSTVPAGSSGLLAQYLFGEDNGDGGTTALDSSGKGISMTLEGIKLRDPLTRPRYYAGTAVVGERIPPPPSEVGAGIGDSYQAGHIRLSEGTSFSVSAYIDPVTQGIDLAASGAIIPVNVIPGADNLEVWWFRKSGLDESKGFKPLFWPSVVARYQLQWPSQPNEIVLASNKGSGPLNSFEARGGLYFQNDKSLPGFNPNEEHALLQGGQVWALRDDLNVTSGANFSSLPFVLLEYAAPDGRPAMTVYKVLREKPSEGVTFTYKVAAGTILQAPMPLPLLEKPFGPKPPSGPRRSVNEEIKYRTIASSSASESGAKTSLTTSEFHQFAALEMLHAYDPRSSKPPLFFLPTSVTLDPPSMEGIFGSQRYGLTNWMDHRQVTDANQWRFKLATSSSTLQLTNGTVILVVNPTNSAVYKTILVNKAIFGSKDVVPAVSVAGIVISSEQQREKLERSFVGSTFIDLKFEAGLIDEMKAGALALRAIEALEENTFRNERISLTTVAPKLEPAAADLYLSTTFQDRKGNLWVYRGPHSEDDPEKFQMQFYYPTLPGFFFPSLAVNKQPEAGTITPYLRPINKDGTVPSGKDPIYGDIDHDGKADQNALAITYEPYWPASTPVLFMGETLTLPKRGLPSVRGQRSLEVLYQQSQVTEDDDEAVSVVLHDPTREKSFVLTPPDGATSSDLTKIPSSVKTQAFRGRTYFPNLPPHLSERFFLDPSRSPQGTLVFQGKFVDSPVGDDYVLLNVVGKNDRDYLNGLCLADDPSYGAWTNAIASLQTTVEHFKENPSKPGTFIVDGEEDYEADQLSLITSSDEAVDSYALSSTGPGIGFVTLLAGNGVAFTPESEPVSLHVIRVVDTLYRGEVKLVESSNPLSEQVSFQQVTDLAGQSDLYDFEWRIAAPVDGVPPLVSQNLPTSIMGAGTWDHLAFPLDQETASTARSTVTARLVPLTSGSITARSSLALNSPSVSADGKLVFQTQGSVIVVGNKIALVGASGDEILATAVAGTTTTQLVLALDDKTIDPLSLTLLRASEAPSTSGGPSSVVYRSFETPIDAKYSALWVSLALDPAMGAKVFIDGQPVATTQMAQDNTATSPAPGSLGALPLAFSLAPAMLDGGKKSGEVKIHEIVVELYSSALPGTIQAFDVQVAGYTFTDLVDVPGSQWLPLDRNRYMPDGVRLVLGGTADVRSLSDNYVIMRYKATDTNHVSFPLGWSQWTEPQLAEGWIKRVLKGINPFNQRASDLFNNRVNTEVSLITQAGARWEGDVALNLDTINNYGLIEIYETVARRGKMLSISSGINYGPANDALMLVTSYLNDLYMMLGNEAWTDAANPTIGIGTKDNKYGDIATALFAFKGQVASLLDEELALLRGRDDFLQPGVEVAPVYNRLFWNYTRGINSGEVIYALNYNIKENADTGVNGVIDADDARKMFPQGHGDAYGHYLTALKGYYSLLLDNDFDWVPRTEAVTVLGKPVQVDYQDERKFTAAAAALGRSGKQVLDLTWRADYVPGKSQGWAHLAKTRDNDRRNVPVTRFWGVDHWSSRVAQGAYVNWVVGNAILPSVDPDPTHEGIQKIDRTTVPELTELVTLLDDTQNTVDSAEGGLTPLGLAETSVAFDINPNRVTGTAPETHFEQIYERAKVSLNNALSAFNDAKNVTQSLRSEQDSLTEIQAKIAEQEKAYQNSLIELYGTPYPDDVGPGKTYPQGFTGPDLIHYSYVDLVEQGFPTIDDPKESKEVNIDLQGVPEAAASQLFTSFDSYVLGSDPKYKEGEHYLKFTVGPHGFFDKPESWTGKRSTPGKIQQAISQRIRANSLLRQALGDAEDGKFELDQSVRLFKASVELSDKLRAIEKTKLALEQSVASVEFATAVYDLVDEFAQKKVELTSAAIKAGIPRTFIAGLAAGGDMTSVARATLDSTKFTITSSFDAIKLVKFVVGDTFKFAQETAARWLDFDQVAPLEHQQELKEAVAEFNMMLIGLQGAIDAVNDRLRDADDAERNYKALVAQGERIQAEREVFRQRSAAIIQGYRTRDAAFRIFRSEKLERYKTLFDLASRYAFLAANAYDYETGLLNTAKGKSFVSRIVSSRALGVMQDGQPAYAGSDTGDPGLSSALAEMKADWDVLKGRLGFNNPDAYGTTTSLRTENFRILPGTDGDQNWKDTLQAARKDNVLDDADVRRYCMQIDGGTGGAVPGIVLEFSTTIANGLNFYGKPRSPGDHWYSPSSFATKIFSAGVAFPGYVGMDNPSANTTAVTSSGGTSPTDPTISFLDGAALGATPHVYLIPVGVDSMRSPPLGDASNVRVWSVDDVTIPLPFNIGGSTASTKLLYQSADSLSEEMFSIRKHQAFRAVSSASLFTPNIYGGSSLVRSQFTNSRLIGRSVWNSKWKLVIPGTELLSDPKEGLDRFIRSVRDVKLHFVTYSYAGN